MKIRDTKKDKLLVIVGRRIKELREEAGMRQEDLAAMLGNGCTRSLVNMWESGERQIKLEVLDPVADLFHTSADYIMGRSDCRVTDTDVRAVSDYLNLSGKAVEHLRCSAVPPVNEFIESDEFMNLCSTIEEASSSIEDLRMSVRVASRFIEAMGEEKIGEKGPEALSELMEQIKEEAVNLNDDTKMGRLGVFEVSEAAGKVFDDAFDSRTVIRKAQELQNLLFDEYQEAEKAASGS